MKFDIMGLNGAVEFFYKCLEAAIELCVPMTGSKFSKFPHWYSVELKHIITVKNIFHKQWMISRDIEDEIKFKKVRAQCLKLTKQAHRKHTLSLQNQAKYNAKEFWKFVNSKRKSFSYPNVMTLNNATADDMNGIAELFASHFKTSYKPATTGSPLIPTASNISIDLSCEDVLAAIKTLKPAYYTAPDQIPAIFLKKCSSALAYPLYLIFKRSLTEGVFPDIWRSSFVTPIFKDGDRSMVSNYRPISLISPMANLFERVIQAKLISQVAGVLSHIQHGFIPGKSITTNLLELADQVTDAFECGLQVDAVYLDMSKAFDSIDHSLLLKKLAAVGW